MQLMAIIKLLALSLPLLIGCAAAESDAPKPQVIPEREISLPGKDGDSTVPLKLCFIPAGTFTMGSPVNEKGRFVEEGPRHEVHITKAFWMGKYEVTNAQFEAFTQATGYTTDAEKRGEAFGWDETKEVYGMVKGLNWRNPKTPGKQKEVEFGQLPVCHVSWNDAVAFCEWASKATKEKVTLPTEAQWEFACRAGSDTKYWWGSSDKDVCQYANVSNLEYKGTTGFADDLEYFPCKDNFMDRAPVGQFKPNALGLHDMSGNLWEWCRDWYGKTYYKQSPKEDPTGPETGTERVLRGGGWGGRPYFLANVRVARRASHTPGSTPYPLGFRVVVETKP